MIEGYINGYLMVLCIILFLATLVTIPFSNFFSQSVTAALYFVAGIIAIRDTNHFGSGSGWFCLAVSCFYALDAYRKKGLSKKVETENTIGINQASALAAYRKDAEQGLASAQSALGKMYYIGTGIKQDYEESYFWYSLAAISDRLFANRPAEVAKFLSPAQIAAVDKRVAEWKPTMAAR